MIPHLIFEGPVVTLCGLLLL